MSVQPKPFIRVPGTVFLAGIMAFCCQPSSFAGRAEPRKSKEPTEFSIAFIKKGSLFWNQRFFERPDGGPCFMRIHQVPLSEEGPIRSFEIYDRFSNDARDLVNRDLPSRWRLWANEFWATSRSVDDLDHGIFRIRLDALEEAREQWAHSRFFFDHVYFEKGTRFSRIHAGGDLIDDLHFTYWWAKEKWQKFLGRGPVGIKEISFDFLPRRRHEVLLFILLAKECGVEEEEFVEARRANPVYDFKNGQIGVWRCRDFPLRSTKKKSEFPTDYFPPMDLLKPDTQARLQETIESSMTEPFYIFEQDEDYYFLSVSGKLFFAGKWWGKTTMTPSDILASIKDLGDLDFRVRAKAEQRIRRMGKAGERFLQQALAGDISLEQKVRLNRILKDIEKQTGRRKAVVVWDQGVRSVQHLILDQDRNKVFAFTKKDAAGTVYFFEIREKVLAKIYRPNSEKRAMLNRSLPDPLAKLHEYALFLGRDR